MKYDSILSEVLKEIILNSEEQKKLKTIANDFCLKLKKHGIEAKLGGSLAKGTIIKSKKIDLDIFVLCKHRDDFSKILKVLKKIDVPGKLKIVHGSRDYYQIEGENYVLEIVPTIKVSDPKDAKNVTDVSLFHVNYIKSKVEKNPEVVKEIALAKKFCKSCNCYGAESYIKGFSGYSLEVLVCYFGSFINFLKKVDKEKVYDPENHFKNKKQVLFEINESKLKSPIIVVDPTYKYRNVTAGLGNETFRKFIYIKNKFLKSPSIDFFKDSTVNVEEFRNLSKSKNATFYNIQLTSNKDKGDIFGTKCKKFFDFFCEELKRNNQEILKKDFYYDGKSKVANGYVVVKEKEEITRAGPSKKLKKASDEFIKQNPNYFLKFGKLYAKKKVSVKQIYNFVNSKGKDMGAWAIKLTSN